MNDCKTPSKRIVESAPLHLDIGRFSRHSRAWKIILVGFFTIVQYLWLRTLYNPYSKSFSSESLRPNLHFTTRKNWVNDPNGLFVDANGTLHLYYQYLEDSWEAGDCKSWGHATSEGSGYDWKIHPIALHCDEYGMWSGSIVVDTNNTSGLFPKDQINGVVAIYTQHHLQTGTEEQAIAYSSDGGYTFQKYRKNPVLRLEPTSYNFRDPKVIWHEDTKRWVMAVAHAADQEIAFYTSQNLLDWTAASIFRNPSLDNTGTSFECPNLVSVPFASGSTHDERNQPKFQDSWVLLVSSGSGSPLNGGSVTRYFPGSFNGTHFYSIDDRADRLIDFGPDNYASQFFYGTPARSPLLSIGWASNLAYCSDTPTGPREGWRGALTAPRTNALAKTENGDVLFMSPPLGLDKIQKKTILPNVSLQDKKEIKASFGKWGGALLLEARFEILQDAEITSSNTPLFEFYFLSSTSHEEVACQIAFQVDGTRLLCDRSKAQKDWSFPDSMLVMSSSNFEVMNKDNQRTGSLQIVFDRSILEAYLNGGLQTGTLTFYPTYAIDRVVLKTIAINGRVKVKVQLQELIVKVIE
jgi:beta-fructofuranosidase